MRSASTLFDKLFGTYGQGHPTKQPIKFARTLVTELSLSAVTLLTRHAGEVISQTLFVEKGWKCTNALANDLWMQAVANKNHVGSYRLVPVPQLPPDFLTGQTLLGVLVLEGEGEAVKLLDNSLLHRISLYAARFLRGELERRLLQAHRKLASIQNRAAVSADAYYHVAKQIRKTLHLGGTCGIFTWRKGTLQPVAVLRGELQQVTKVSKRSRRLETGIALDGLSRKDIEGIEAFVWDKQANHITALLRETPVEAGSDIPSMGVSGIRLEKNVDPELGKRVQAVLEAIEQKHWGKGLSCIICPLTWRHAFLGAVFIWSEVPQAFTLEEALTARDLASYCVAAMARDQRIEGELDLLEQTATLYPDISLHTNPSLRAFLTTLCRRFRVHRSADLVTLIPYDHRTGEMQLALAASSPRTEIFSSTPTHEGSLRKVLAEGELEWHASESSSFGEDSFVKKEDIKSFFAVALKMKKIISDESSSNAYKEVESPIGVLFVDYKRERRHFSQSGKASEVGFSEYEKKWIRRYAKIAQEYLSVYDRLAWQHRVDDAITEIYHELVQKDANPEEILRKILETGMALVEATAGLLAVPSDDFYGLTVLQTKGYPSDKEKAEINFGQGVTGACAQRRKPVVIANSDDPTTWPSGVEPLRWVPGSKSELAVPLLSNDTAAGLIGVLNVDSNRALAAFGRQEEEALQRLAEAGVIAINMLRDLRQKQSIVKISEEIKRLRSEDEIYRIVLQEIVDVTGAFVAIARGPDPTQRFLIKKKFVSRRSARSLMSEKEELAWSETPLPLDQGLTAQAFHNRKTEIVKDTWVDAPPHYLQCRKETRSEIAVPVALDADHIGVLNIQHVQPYVLMRYQGLIEALAFQASFSLYQMRRLDTKLLAKDVEVLNAGSELSFFVSHSIGRFFSEIREMAAEHTEQLKMKMIWERAEQGLQKTENLAGWLPGTWQEPVIVKPVYIIRDFLETLKSSPFIGDAQISFTCDPESEDKHIQAKGKLLEWCLERIIENSSRHRSREITIFASSTLSEFKIEIANDGDPLLPGRKPEELYAQNKPWRPEGHGMALVLCSKYVSGMHGQIWSEKREPAGLITYLQFPLHIE